MGDPIRSTVRGIAARLVIFLTIAPATVSSSPAWAASASLSSAEADEPAYIETGATVSADALEEPEVALRVLGRHAGDQAVRFRISNVGAHVREIRLMPAHGHRGVLAPDVRLVSEPCPGCLARREPPFRSRRALWMAVMPGESLTVDLRLDWPEDRARAALPVRSTPTAVYYLASAPVLLTDLPVLEAISAARAVAIADSAMAALLGVPVPERSSWSGTWSLDAPEDCSWWTCEVGEPECDGAARLTRSVVQLLPGPRGCRSPGRGYRFRIDAVAGKVLFIESARWGTTVSRSE